MAIESGQFGVGEFEGKFVAIATSAPFFCFRADSEDELDAKVRRAVKFWKGRISSAPTHIGTRDTGRRGTTTVVKVVSPSGLKKRSIAEVLETA